MDKLWTISEIWNTATEQREARPVKPREKIWASELGKQDLDIYLKLTGEEVSNDFDARSLRKFEAGNLFEWVVQLVLMRCGIYKESQKWIGFKPNPKMLEVSGRLDHLAGGRVDYEKSMKEIESLQLPEFFARATEQILSHFTEKYPDGLPTQGIEVKSTSSFGIEKVYQTKRAMAGHDLQAFHYAYNERLPFNLLYICRDDLRMAEIPIMPDNEELKERYLAKISSVSGFYFDKQEPPKEPEILFNEEEKKFSKNFNVEYSGYLKRNYGYETPAEYDDKISPIVMGWNRIISRIKENKDLTKNNNEKIDQMQDMGFNFEEIKKKLL